LVTLSKNINVLRYPAGQPPPYKTDFEQADIIVSDGGFVKFGHIDKNLAKTMPYRYRFGLSMSSKCESKNLFAGA